MLGKRIHTTRECCGVVHETREIGREVLNRDGDDDPRRSALLERGK